MDLLRFPFRSLWGTGRQRRATRRCILHVGSPKTGTSSIQTMLKKNRRQLLKHGILVPQSGQGRNGCHRALAYDLAGLPIAPKDNVEQKFVREVGECNADTILISSEFMWPLLAVRAQAERLIGCLRSADFEIVLVVYVRNQPQYLNSSYVQNVKTRLWADEFPVFARRALARRGKYSYSHWMAFAESHAVALLARPFSEAVRRSGVTQDFLATIGLSSTTGFDTAIERNVSVGPFSVEVARSLLRGVGDPKRVTEQQRADCRHALHAELKRRKIDDRGYCGLTTELAAQIEQVFADDNSRFAQSAWGKPWSEVFAADLGRSFEPNDYSVTGVPADRRQLLGEVLDSLKPKVDAILSGSLPTGSHQKRWTLSRLTSRFSL